MVETGLFEYSWPRTDWTRCECETPSPITMRPGASSASVLRMAFRVIGSRA